MNNNIMDNDTVSFDDNANVKTGNAFVYDEINGLGQSDYENEDLFNVEISDSNEYDGFEASSLNMQLNYPNEEETTNDDDNKELKEKDNDEDGVSNVDSNTPLDESPESTDNNSNSEFDELPYLGTDNDATSSINDDYLDMDSVFVNSYLDDNYNLPVVEPTVEPVVEKKSIEKSKTSLSDTPISELEKLTEYTEEKIQTTDIKSLFDKVGTNVKEASDIFKKNTEMKEKLDSRFEELKKLQLEVEKSKKLQYDEINSYKEEVLSKLTEKKEEIEKRLNRLKEFQSTLEKDRLEFEQYKKQEKDEIDRVQKEIQEAYDSRREELSHIEDVLRKQKDALDEERSQLSLDRIQYESDKNELANNLLKFNEIVDSFTNGMDKMNKE